MKKHVTPSFIFAALSLFFCLSTQAQQNKNTSSNEMNERSKHIQPVTSTQSVTPHTSAKTTLVTNCTDKINYVGNTSQYYVPMGGSGNAVTGLYQTFPNYEGKVYGVEFDASKSPTVVGNPVVYVRVYDLNVSPLTTFPLSNAISVVITNTALTTYSVVFPTPVVLSSNNGFAIGIVNSSSSSKPQIHLGTVSNNQYNYSWLTDVSGGTYPYNLSAYFSNLNGAIDVLIRPIVSTSVNPSWLSAKTSTGCVLPAVYDFTNTSPAPSFYVNNDQMICPGGLDDQIDFGDGSAPIPFYGTPHSYTNIGNYVASFTETYIGWTNNCVSTITTAIQVDNPSPAFTYTINGQNVTFNNTSVGLNSFVWNFGDLSTSTQQNPGSHSYSTPGTYFVELEGTAPCGKVRYSISIVIAGNVGINENTTLSNQISLYPNPAKNRLVLTNKGELKFEEKLSIFNSFGELIKTVEHPEFVSGNTEIEISNLSTGIYFVKLISKDQVVIKSFVKE